MPGIHSTTIQVPREAIDANGHVNNLEYLRWLVELAVAHSEAAGWGAERYQTSGGTWVARSHFIEYLGAAFEGDVLSLHTWVDEPGSSSWLRHYLVWRAADERPLARAETLWVFVDTRSGRARRIPDALRSLFTAAPSTEEVLRELGLPPGADGRAAGEGRRARARRREG